MFLLRRRAALRPVFSVSTTSSLRIADPMERALTNPVARYTDMTNIRYEYAVVERAEARRHSSCRARMRKGSSAGVISKKAAIREKMSPGQSPGIYRSRAFRDELYLKDVSAPIAA